MENAIELAPLTGYLTEIIMAVVTVMIGFAANAFRKKMKIEQGGALDDVLDRAIQYGIHYANIKLDEKGKNLTYETKNEFLADVVEYVVKGAPSALNHFGLTPERIAEMVEARLDERFTNQG